jgi:hypothetical protein
MERPPPPEVAAAARWWADQLRDWLERHPATRLYMLIQIVTAAGADPTMDDVDAFESALARIAAQEYRAAGNELELFHDSEPDGLLQAAIEQVRPWLSWPLPTATRMRIAPDGVWVSSGGGPWIRIWPSDLSHRTPACGCAPLAGSVMPTHCS